MQAPCSFARLLLFENCIQIKKGPNINVVLYFVFGPVIVWWVAFFKQFPSLATTTKNMSCTTQQVPQDSRLNFRPLGNPDSKTAFPISLQTRCCKIDAPAKLMLLQNRAFYLELKTTDSLEILWSLFFKQLNVWNFRQKATPIFKVNDWVDIINQYDDMLIFIFCFR